MNKVRKFLYPLSVLYGEITKARNKMFDKGILKSVKFEFPVIVVGNLSVGGTGKTPQIEYLIRLLKNKYRIAVLSRGYKRKSKGFIIADESSNAIQIGDEPFQYYQKFNTIIVSVDADRVHGIQQLNQLKTPPEIILLDDAYQHRKVEAGFNILLTPYNDLYVDDAMLPSGNLRENIEGANRAQIIIVTKCPNELSENEQFEIASKLNPTLYQTVFFTTISYAEYVKNKIDTILVGVLIDYEVLLVTGIANPKPLKEFLESKEIKFQHLKYPDHHHFSDRDIEEITSEFETFSGDKKIILTTEKDFVRLNSHLEIYYIEIETSFLNFGNDFDRFIEKFIFNKLKKEE